MILDYNFFIVIILIIILILLIVVIILTKLNSSDDLNMKYQENDYNYNENYDTIIHMSSETLTVDGIYHFLSKYPKDFVSLNQCYLTNQLITFQSKFNFDNIPPTKSNSTNFITHINNKYIEMFLNDNYIGASKCKYLLKEEMSYYKGTYNNQMFIIPLVRLKDDLKFIFVQMTQTYNGYFNYNKYKGIAELIKTFKEYYPDTPYIVTGDFNIHGHEKVFKDILDDAIVCDFYKTCTCNDNEGFASPDGLVVSNKLYKKVEYEVDYFEGFTAQHYIIKAKLYINGDNKSYNKTNKNYTKTLNYYMETTKRPIHVGKEGEYESYIKDKVTPIKNKTKISNFYTNETQGLKNNTYKTIYDKVTNLT